MKTFSFTLVDLNYTVDIHFSICLVPAVSSMGRLEASMYISVWMEFSWIGH